MWLYKIGEGFQESSGAHMGDRSDSDVVSLGLTLKGRVRHQQDKRAPDHSGNERPVSGETAGISYGVRLGRPLFHINAGTAAQVRLRPYPASRAV